MCRGEPCPEARQCISSTSIKDNDSNTKVIIILIQVEEAVLSATEGAIHEAEGGVVRQQLQRRLQPPGASLRGDA